MNDWTASQIKEIIYDQIETERRHRDELRKEDRERSDTAVKSLSDRFEAYTEDANKALKLQADETQRRLEVYPTIKDFNTLKSRVDIELESRASSSKGVIIIFQIMSAIAIIVSVGLAILSYGRGIPPH